MYDMTPAYSISYFGVATIISGIKTRMKRISRRNFLQTTSSAIVAGAMLNRFSLGDTRAAEAEVVTSRRLLEWEYRRGSLGGPWEAWRKANDDANTWEKVQVPHCFNARDA